MTDKIFEDILNKIEAIGVPNTTPLVLVLNPTDVEFFEPILNKPTFVLEGDEDFPKSFWRFFPDF